ncbi:TadE/TadG family type IV pilus assembly protein [Roseovarius tibetensis]|uniref:TadE/TadG family type IV pilus assembly protein n=1 Tax=Roseovarius tibetensis TaxID=2685897 RepID=UPI003D7F1BC3
MRHDERGSIAVEFALVAPVLLVIIAAVIDIGSAAYGKLSLDARVTAAAEYALGQSAPPDQTAAELAEKLVALLQGGASQTAEVNVNNAALARWTGSAISVDPLSGDGASCYCPTRDAGEISWGPAVGCATTCTTGESAGQFVRLSADARHVSLFPGYAFIEGETVKASTVLRLQ